MRTIRDAATVILAASGILAAGAASAVTRDPAAVFVNELHYDNSGVDQNEAVEVAGPAETDLAGCRLVSTAAAMAATTSPRSCLASSRIRVLASAPS